MNRKRIRQMTGSLLRRLTTQPNLRFTAPYKEMLTGLLEDEKYIQRFAALFDGGRLRCGAVLELCRAELERLSPAPEEGWLLFTYDFVRKSMFPEREFEPRRERHGAGAVFFLSLLQVLLDAERVFLPSDPMWELELLEEDELTDSAYQDSYRQFVRSYRREYVYEMMRLGLEVTPFRALEHIAGVHHVALSVARDLKKSGVPVDLALVSGSAAGHDMGKFGCKRGERIPYLHYYYTDRWFARRRMEDIGYVAANHSVWDLELDYLSVESLALIYADFRVKQERGFDGREITKIFTLAEAFDVILSKLDNVTEEKRRRYTFVYAKLQDFENFMVDRGVDVTLRGGYSGPALRRDVALLDEAGAVERLKDLVVEHNIQLMSRLTDQRGFAGLLEQARSETDWKKLRAYLGVFESYSVYLSIPQKIQTLTFLYELLMHREGDIRRQAATLMGEIIAGFHAGYAKEKPADYVPGSRDLSDLEQWKLYLEKIIHPDHKLMDQHKRWIGFTLKMVVNSLLTHCAVQQREQFLTAFLRYYRCPERLDGESAFQLLETATALPLEVCSDRQRYELLVFAETLSKHSELKVRTAAVLLLDYLRNFLVTHDIILHALQSLPCDDSRTLTLLRDLTIRDISAAAGDEPLQLDEDTMSEVFLDNLKTATPWIIKEVNIRLLSDFARAEGVHMLHIATHLTNLIKVSDRVTVRHRAGAALLEIAPRLTHQERNEVAVELCRGLEIGQQEFSKYIPDYLGRFCLWLPPEELEEILQDLGRYLCSANSSIVSTALDTVGVIYEEYDTYRVRFPESADVYRQRRERLLGMLLKGLAGFRSEVRQEAMYVMGRYVFGSQILGSHEKRQAFLLTLKKILALISEDRGGDLTFYYRCAMLGRLGRFITEQEIDYGGFRFEGKRPVAFFPGTFDPFTLSHKGIVRAIRDLGYEVMLAIDEFSWSKKTQPHRVRRRIARISVADEFHVHIFPEDFPVNIANPANLAALRAAFPDREVSIVVGSDVVAGASSYQKVAVESSIHTFDHIIFRRDCGESTADYSCITGKVVELKLPEHLEEISSTRLREAIDRDRDISNLVDPVAQELIYLHGLYLREPQDKPVLRTEDLIFQRILRLDEDMCRILLETVLSGRADGGKLCEELQKLGDQLMILRNGRDDSVLGFAAFRCLESHELYKRLGSMALSGLVRQNAGGRALVISGIFVPRGPSQMDFCQLLLTEVLALALRQEYAYALCCPTEGTLPAYAREILSLQGFVPVRADGEKRELMTVDMKQPIVLTRNVDAAIKAPFSSNSRVLAALGNAHRKLQRTLTGLYPGCLVLSISAGVIQNRLLHRIAACNGVPPEPTRPRKLGECICVPFGKILRGVVVPNTVTKTLHTDKVYEPDLSAFTIEAYPHYSPLEDQVRTIRAFDRPAILVDDMLHDGKRIRRIAPLLEESGVPVRQVLVGYLTGMGRDLMEELGHPVDSIYYLPSLRMRFVESTLYPFIGGDTVRRGQSLAGRLQPGINRIFPYAAPEFREDCADGSTYKLSLCCLENARDILLTLETEYRALYARNLTLSRLGEVITLPLCPDKGSCMMYDPSRAASTYLDNDIEMLGRMRADVRIVIGE